MEQEKKPYRPTPEELSRLLQEADQRVKERMATDPAYREEIERLDRMLFGPQTPKVKPEP